MGSYFGQASPDETIFSVGLPGLVELAVNRNSFDERRTRSEAHGSVKRALTRESQTRIVLSCLDGLTASFK